MPANLNEYDKLVELIENISPDHPARKYDIENLQTLVALSTSITLQDRHRLRLKLFNLRLEAQVAQSENTFKQRS
jgi:ribosomal protein L29